MPWGQQNKAAVKVLFKNEELFADITRSSDLAELLMASITVSWYGLKGEWNIPDRTPGHPSAWQLGPCPPVPPNQLLAG